MIRSFRDKRTEQLFRTSNVRGLPTEIIDRARRKLMALNAAQVLDDLKVPPSNRLEALKGDRIGQCFYPDKRPVAPLLWVVEWPGFR